MFSIGSLSVIIFLQFTDVKSEVFYEGLALYNASVESPCILNHQMKTELAQFPENSMKRREWLLRHRKLICNFNKFLKCAHLSDILDNYEGDTVQIDFDHTTSLGVCRCLKSTFTLVGDTCYLPAKADCGQPFREAYPISPWHGAPPLIPACTPGGECDTSSRRCECQQGYHADPDSGLCLQSKAARPASIPTAVTLIIFYVLFSLTI